MFLHVTGLLIKEKSENSHLCVPFRCRLGPSILSFSWQGMACHAQHWKQPRSEEPCESVISEHLTYFHNYAASKHLPTKWSYFEDKPLRHMAVTPNARSFSSAPSLLHITSRMTVFSVNLKCPTPGSSDSHLNFLSSVSRTWGQACLFSLGCLLLHPHPQPRTWQHTPLIVSCPKDTS